MRVFSATARLPVLLCLSALVAPAAEAGTTVIHVETEGAGDVVRNGSPPSTNTNGAAVWNGQEWVVNNTWAHKFFVDTRTNNRLKSYELLGRFTGTTPLGDLGMFAAYRITRNRFTYEKRSAAGNGRFVWEAVEYEVADSFTGKVVLLRSRGVGGGLSATFFDVLIEDDTTSGSSQTTAFLGDPAWFTFPVAPRAAAALGADALYRTGDLPGARTQQGTAWADYYLDMGGGSDLGPAGVGRSYEMECHSLEGRVEGPSGSYVTAFHLKWMDSSGNLKALRFYPALISERFEPDPGASLPILVPVVVSSDGKQGAYFTTELTLTNRSTTDASLALTYTASLGEGSGHATVTLPAGQQTTIPDAITYLKSLGLPLPDSGKRLGTLRFDVGGPQPGEVAVTARTTTVVPEGRAGLAYPAAADISLLRGPARLFGLRSNATDRSNVALLNAGPGEARLRLTVTSGSLAAPGSGSFESAALPSGGFLQYTLEEVVARAGLTLVDPNVSVKVEIVSGAGPYYAYGVVNDQGNSDGSFIFPVPESTLVGRTSLVLPVVVETGSALPFTTELVVANTSTSKRSLRLAYVTTFGTIPGGVAVDSLSLEPGEQRIVPSFVDDLRSRGVAGIGAKGSTFAGALYATSTESLATSAAGLDGVLLGARTTAPGTVAGRYGLFCAALSPRETASTAAWVYGLRQDAANRSNLAFVNADPDPSAAAIRLRVEIFRASDGQKVATVEGPETTLAPGAWTQINAVLEKYAPGVASAWARVSRVSGDAPFLVYGVVNDGARSGERSGDGAYVPMVVE